LRQSARRSQQIIEIAAHLRNLGVPGVPDIGGKLARQPAIEGDQTGVQRMRGRDRSGEPQGDRLACKASGSSPISSSSKVPLSAARNRPSPASPAPVKAPLRWPNSSASSIASGMAAQLTATKGPSRRGERR